MGLRFRKSINLGIFKINISKSGVGYSFGTKGMRYTKKAAGGTRRTFSIPGTGISYVKDSKKRKRNKNHVAVQSKEQAYSESTYREITDSSSNKLINKMNAATWKNKLLSCIKIILTSIALISLLYFWRAADSILLELTSLFLMILSLLTLILIPKSVSIDLDYSFEELDSEVKFNNLLSSIINLTDSKKVWEIDSLYFHNDVKNKAESKASVSRSDIKVKRAKFLRSSYKVYSVDIKDRKLIFLPDIIAIYQKKKWWAVEWSHLNITINPTVFAEAESIPSDAEIIGYTYLHRNKNGGPDKRYSFNPQIAQCRYYLIGIESINGLNVILMLSNRNVAQSFYNALCEMKNCLS